ncbi:hypothetical protein, partial [Pseudomonas sp. Root401]|uniref:hypothetical protein n=1 Tax=Pseudomonas sp. Root401 TaxID=1736526 RepID=UPI001F3F1101
MLFTLVGFMAWLAVLTAPRGKTVGQGEQSVGRVAGFKGLIASKLAPTSMVTPFSAILFLMRVWLAFIYPASEWGIG